MPQVVAALGLSSTLMFATPLLALLPALAPSTPTAAGHRFAAEQALPEVRAVWLGPELALAAPQIARRAEIARAIDELAASGFNTVYASVWRDGQTLYPSKLATPESGFRADPRLDGRDFLAEVVAEGHRAGLEVFAWFEGGFQLGTPEQLADFDALPPSWLARDAQGLPLEARGHLWLDALEPQVSAFMRELVLDVCARYDIDGVQLDRWMPALPIEAAASASALDAFRVATDGKLEPQGERWRQWRASRLTNFLGELAQSIHALDANLVVAAAPLDGAQGASALLQDVEAWSRTRSLDVLTPQVDGRASAADQALAARLIAGGLPRSPLAALPRPLLTRIDDAHWSPDALVDALALARERGYGSDVSFDYAALQRRGAELAIELRAGPYARTAYPSYRENAPWRPRGMIFPGSIEQAEGPWESTPESQDIYRLRGGVQGSFRYFIAQPRSAHFDVYTWIAADEPELARSATFLLQGGDERAWVELDLGRVREAGWHRLGTLHLTAGAVEEPVRLIATEGDRRRWTLAGPILLAVNRRLSPETHW